MSLDKKDWRPITFEGEKLPATFMGITVLEPILEFDDEDLGSWLFRLATCRGVQKDAPSERCMACSARAIQYLERGRDRVLDGIRDRLGPHGFDPDKTYEDWLAALKKINKVSEQVEGNCIWYAPLHERDPIQSEQDVASLLENLNKSHAKYRKKRL